MRNSTPRGCFRPTHVPAAIRLAHVQCKVCLHDIPNTQKTPQHRVNAAAPTQPRLNQLCPLSFPQCHRIMESPRLDKTSKTIKSTHSPTPAPTIPFTAGKPPSGQVPAPVFSEPPPMSCAPPPPLPFRPHRGQLPSRQTHRGRRSPLAPPPRPGCRACASCRRFPGRWRRGGLRWRRAPELR